MTFYSPLDIGGADDRRASRPSFSRVSTTDWNTYSRFVTIPAGETMTIDVQLAGFVDDPNEVVTWEQPLVDRAPSD